MPTTARAADRQDSATRYLALRDSSAMSSSALRAATALAYPIGLVSVLDDVNQYILGRYGVDAVGRVPARDSMCRFVVELGEPLAVDDARDDPRFADLPPVRDGHVRSYVGVPLVGNADAVVGSLSVADGRPRQITSADIRRMTDLARSVESQLAALPRAQLRPPLAPSEKLRRAVRAGEIVPWYQPIVDLRDGQPVGYEALARWQRPDGEVWAADAFLPEVDDHTVIDEMDDLLLQTALSDFARCPGRPPEVRLSLNVATQRLLEPGRANELVALAAAAGVATSDVTLELTEMSQVVDLRALAEVARNLREAGFEIVLDDVGTGWSGLGWLLELPFDGLKVDRALGGAIGSLRGDAILRAMVAMSHELGAPLTVEGIETDAQAVLARELGAHTGQGFLWGPAAPALHTMPVRHAG